MIQPKRWLDDEGMSLEIRDLIRAGQRPPPFPKLALGAVIVPLAQKAAWASSFTWPAAAAVAAKATTVGLVIGLGSIAAVTTWSGRHSQALVTSPSVTHPSRDSRVALQGNSNKNGLPESSAVQAPPSEPVVPPADAAANPAGPVPAIAVASEARSGVAAAPARGIAAEAELLDRARALLGESPTRSLMLTAEHRTRFPTGQMSAERELLAIDALLRLGRLDEAQQRATPFLANGSNQVFAARVRHLLERGGQ